MEKCKQEGFKLVIVYFIGMLTWIKVFTRHRHGNILAVSVVTGKTSHKRHFRTRKVYNREG